MAQLPSGHTKNIFSVGFDGVYGRFKTTDSYELAYLLTTLRNHDLAALETASEAFDFRKISFDEVIQRDIDFERVDDELIAKYLEKGANRVLFFPPILVSIVTFENGERMDTYKHIRTTPPTSDNPIIRRVWDDDKFQLELNYSASPTGHKLEYQGNEYSYIPYAATVSVNPDAVKLVVIDGQHRFAAIRRILNDDSKKHMLKDMEVPCCLFFTPDALAEAASNESVKGDLRELFVTINSTAKTVSGHFMVLLDDKILSSFVVRSFANQLKQDEDATLLPLLEWNTREARKAHQRIKPFSLTTVSIIADCFKRYVFSDPSMTGALLNLTEIQEDLHEAASEPAYNAISESDFAQEHIPLLRKRLDEYVTPALNVLLRKPRPYATVINQYLAALQVLNKQVENHVVDAKTYRDTILFGFRRTTNKDLTNVKSIESDFEKRIQIDDDDQFFFLNIFQQALIRAWAKLSVSSVRTFEVSPEAIAHAMLPVIDKVVCNASKPYLSKYNSYLQTIIFDGEKLRINATSREELRNLILAAFSTPDAINLFSKAIEKFSGNAEKKKAGLEKLSATALKARTDFISSLSAQTMQDLRKNWRFKNLTEVENTNLNALANDEDKSEAFEEALKVICVRRVKEARLALSNHLAIPEKDL